MYSGYSGNMYLSDYYCMNGKNNITLKIHVLGSKTSKVRNEYIITLQKNHFECNCKDFVYRYQKYDILCKHITFIICKVAKILDANVFDNKITDLQFTHIKNTFENKSIWNNRHISVKGINDDFNVKSKFNPDELCPICYDPFQAINKNVSCPECKNHVHKKCMDIWLETNSTCVYCRTYEWKKYVNPKECTNAFLKR